MTSGNGKVDSTGTRRRIQAMVANGRPLAEIAGRLGRKSNAISYILAQRIVDPETALAVSTLYGQIGGRIPEPATAAEQRRFDTARQLAEARGWAPAAAWEDDEIDDPGAQPAEGWQRRPVRGPERWAAIAEDVEFIQATEGGGREHAAKRLGMTPNALERVLTLAARAEREAAPREAEQQAAHACEMEAEAG